MDIKLIDTKRNRIIGGILIAVVVILIIALSVSKESEPNCQLLDSEPLPPDYSKLPILVSDDYRAIANFSSLLQYNFGPGKDSKYLPLDFRSVESEHTQGEYRDNEKLIFKTDCADWELRLSVGNSTIVDYETLQLVTGNFGVTNCSISRPGILYPSEYHYKLRLGHKHVYACYSDTPSGDAKIIVWLHIDALEFEVSDDVEMHKEGKYSKLPYYVD